jgi:hypothetical protein
MGVLLYCDVDENGRIVESLVGERIIPMRQYQYFFYLIDDYETILSNLSKYRVINGKLTLEL